MLFNKPFKYEEMFNQILKTFCMMLHDTDKEYFHKKNVDTFSAVNF